MACPKCQSNERVQGSLSGRIRGMIAKEERGGRLGGAGGLGRPPTSFTFP